MSTTTNRSPTDRVVEVPDAVAGWSLDAETGDRVAYSYGREIETVGYGHGYAITQCSLVESSGRGWHVESVHVRSHLDVDRLRSVDPGRVPDLTALVNPRTVPGDQVVTDPLDSRRSMAAEDRNGAVASFLSMLDAVYPSPEILDPPARYGDWRLVHHDGRDFVWKRTPDGTRPDERLAISSWGLLGYVDRRERLVPDGGSGPSVPTRRSALSVPYHLEPMVKYSSTGEYTYFTSRRAAFEAAEQYLLTRQ